MVNYIVDICFNDFVNFFIIFDESKNVIALPFSESISYIFRKLNGTSFAWVFPTSSIGYRGVTLFLFLFIIKNKDKENLYIYKIKIKLIFIFIR